MRIGNFFVISNQYLNLILVVYDSMWTLSENHFVISNQYLNLIMNLILVVYLNCISFLGIVLGVKRIKG